MVEFPLGDTYMGLIRSGWKEKSWHFLVVSRYHVYWFAVYALVDWSRIKYIDTITFRESFYIPRKLSLYSLNFIILELKIFFFVALHILCSRRFFLLLNV